MNSKPEYTRNYGVSDYEILREVINIFIAHRATTVKDNPTSKAEIDSLVELRRNMRPTAEGVVIAKRVLIEDFGMNPI